MRYNTKITTGPNLGKREHNERKGKGRRQGTKKNLIVIENQSKSHLKLVQYLKEKYNMLKCKCIFNPLNRVRQKHQVLIN